jgi:hypothetical protein
MVSDNMLLEFDRGFVQLYSQCLKLVVADLQPVSGFTTSFVLEGRGSRVCMAAHSGVLCRFGVRAACVDAADAFSAAAAAGVGVTLEQVEQALALFNEYLVHVSGTSL